MNDPMMKIRILAKSEISLAQIRTKKTLAGGAIGSVALLFGLMAFGMLNFAALSALIPAIGVALAALLVGMANLLLAAVVLMVARNVSKEGNEEKMMRELSQMATDEISKDIDKVKADVERINDGIETISTLANATISPIIKLASGRNKRK